MGNYKVFVTLGSQKFQFNRLIESVDSFAEKNKNYDIFIQYGYSNFHFRHCKGVAFTDRDKFNALVSECDILITHAGTGAILSGLRNGKKVIAFPRLKKYGEHVDNHQIEIFKVFLDKQYLLGSFDTRDLESLIFESNNFSFRKFVSNTDKFITSLKELF